MVLLADMGNTNVTVAGWGDGGRVFELRLPTDHSWDGAAYTTALREGLAESGQADALFEGAALCSVVPPLNEAVCAALQAVCGSAPVQLNRRGNTGGVDIFTDDPDEVGNDLLAGAIAATALAPMPAIVADLGTATTFTAQDKGGSILGVAIAPGVAMGLEALAGRASQLFSVAIQGPKAQHRGQPAKRRCAGCSRPAGRHGRPDGGGAERRGHTGGHRRVGPGGAALLPAQGHPCAGSGAGRAVPLLAAEPVSGFSTIF